MALVILSQKKGQILYVLFQYLLIASCLQITLSYMSARIDFCTSHSREGVHWIIKYLFVQLVIHYNGYCMKTVKLIYSFFYLAFYVDSWWGTTTTTTIFIAAAITDWLDGYLARKVCNFFPSNSKQVFYIINTIIFITFIN